MSRRFSSCNSITVLPSTLIPHITAVMLEVEAGGRQPSYCTIRGHDLRRVHTA
jgi:hypothetical protein